MKQISIETPPPEGDCFQNSMLTKIFTDGHEIHGVQKVIVTIEVDEPICAEVELHVLAEFKGATAVQGRFFVWHPRTNERVEIESIKLANGAGEITF